MNIFYFSLKPALSFWRYGMKDIYTIHEFSELTGVEASTLRYWDDIGLFSPIKRNPENNYRYYSLIQILALNFVTTLSELEIPLKTIAGLRKERSPEKLLDLLDKQEKLLDLEMQQLRLRYSILHARRELMNYGMKIEEGMISVLPREEKAIILWPRNTYEEGDTFMEPLAAFLRQTDERHERHIHLSFPVGGYHDDIDSFMNAPNRPDHFFSVDPIGTQTRKAGDYLTGFVRGYYGEFGDLPERFINYINENNVTVEGPVYTLYLHDEISTQDHTQYLAQVGVALSKKKRR